ncbi:ADP-ribosylglycohydrolase [Streptosporangium becharense]|uniref:ADP-ribosylglycohydrolase n=1 Tax=Streptosporangium becharense TaxID=1816182 RepID=A0A7W9IJJ4_9ACTN|nr:ADP-ribosylglycohydrolase family protein [Streptosporangium becharense]MBB2911028.1 ADP-ribosylglycohydrolase [Streptosporangium becharense]MBB5821914.1 ADP-ribosylglycohydrolase [Streptosporangium becharense]
MAANPSTRSAVSLHGLALGDAFGSQFFALANYRSFPDRTPPAGPWEWTDDTQMACCVHRVLADHGVIDQDRLAASFAARYEPHRGYGAAMVRMLPLVHGGGDWRALSAELFEGRGSWGNGAAMRVAPLGAWFADDLTEVVRQAVLSAEVTHAHPEGVAGAVAVAVAAATVATEPGLPAEGFLDRIAEHVPPGMVRDGIAEARRLLAVDDPGLAARTLGNGSRISAQDTVPFTLWVTARERHDFEAAMWTTAAVGGDIDTTCAIVGGIIASSGHADRLPAEWRRRCEPLPDWAGVPPLDR